MALRSSLGALVPPALLLALAPSGCGGTPADPTAGLEATFPGASARVLRVGRGFTPTLTPASSAAGFASAPSSPLAGRDLAVDLPAFGDAPVILRAPGAAPVRVHELLAHGEGRLVERAVAYARDGGASFWTAIAGGAEEWLRFEVGAVHRGEPAAAWQIEGATLTQRGAAVEVQGGLVRLWVTAPAAYAADGAPVTAELRVRGDRIELYVDASGQELLVDPVWMTVAPLPAARRDLAASSLPNSLALVTGGGDEQGHAYADADVYDPAMNSWTPSAMSFARTLHTSTALADGTVLVAGGEDAASNYLNSSEVYNPATSSWGPPSFMNTQHAGHTATLLADGKALIAGGHMGGTSGSGTGVLVISNVDLYDPTLGMGWSAATQMNTPRQYHAAAKLAGTSVLVTGGEDLNYSPVSTAEIYSPSLMTWTNVAVTMSTPRRYHTETLLNDGRVLIVGGDSGADGVIALSSAEIYDPAMAMFVIAASLNTARFHHTATLIPGGQVMVTGGSDGSQSLASTEIYDPTADAWTAGPTLTAARSDHTATVVGMKLLAAGGVDGVSLNSAELLALGLPDGSPSSMASACASGFVADGVCCDTACTGGCLACTAAAKGTGAGTDGACGPAAAGPDPHLQCMDGGALSCGSNGLCDGKGACAAYPAGSPCDDGNACTSDACQKGACMGTNELDGTPCAGGVCIAGKCLLDPMLVATTSSTGGGGASSSAASSSSGSGVTTGGGGGQGGSGGGLEQLEGSGCAAGGRGEAGGLSAGVLALLAAMGVRRRRRG